MKLSALGEEHSVASNLWSLARFTLGTSLDDPTPGASIGDFFLFFFARLVPPRIRLDRYCV